jgi:glycosyltransferase involved in cell wall biosynthesis
MRLKRLTKIVVLTDTVAFTDARAMRAAAASAKAGYDISYISRRPAQEEVHTKWIQEDIEAHQTKILSFAEDKNYKKQLQIFWWMLCKYPLAVNLKAFFFLQFFLLFQLSLIERGRASRFSAYILVIILSPVSMLALLYIFLSRLLRPSGVSESKAVGHAQTHSLRTWLEQASSDEVYVLRALIYRSLEIYYSCRKIVCDLKPDIIHAHDIVNLPAAIWLGNSLGAKVIYDAHELEVFRNTPRGQQWRNVVYKLERYFISQAEVVITVSQGYANELSELYPGIVPKVVNNVPSYYGKHAHEGVDLRQLSNVPDEAGLAVFIGHLRIDRGIRVYLEGISRIPDLHLVICGPHKDEACRILANDLEVLGLNKRVHFAGHIPQRQLINTVASADFSIIPTQPTSKAIIAAMPNKFFESAFAGLPIIVDQRVNGMAGLVEAYHLGMCTLSSDRERLIADLLSMRRNHRILARQMKMHDFVTKFSWEAQTEALLSALAITKKS